MSLLCIADVTKGASINEENLEQVFLGKVVDCASVRDLRLITFKCEGLLPINICTLWPMNPDPVVREANRVVTVCGVA